MSLDATEVLSLWKRAKTVAISKGFRDLSDDFAQYVAEVICSGRKKQLMDFMWIDFMRKHLKRRKTRQIDKSVYRLTMPTRDSHAIFPTDIIPLETLDRQKRALFLLRYQWGLECQEIGYLFGCSESWASSEITLACKMMGIKKPKMSSAGSKKGKRK